MEINGRTSLSNRIAETVRTTLSRVLLLVAVESLVIAMILIMVYVVSDSKNQAREYALQLDTTMEQKKGMLSAIAGGISSGKVTGYEDVLAYVDRMELIDDQVSAVYSCYDENITVMSGGWQAPDDFIVTEREWYKKAQERPEEVYVSDPYVDLQSGGICITLSKATYDTDGKMMGVVGMDMYMDDMVSLIEDSYYGSSYVFLSTADGTILVHPNEEFSLKDETGVNVSEANHGRYAKPLSKNLKTKCILDYKGGLKLATAATSGATGWRLVSVQNMSLVLILTVAMLIVYILIYVITKNIAQSNTVNRVSVLFRPLESINDKMTLIADGDLNVVFDEERNSIEIENLTESLTETIASLGSYIDEITNTVTAISNKDLTVSIDTSFKGSYVQIKDALEAIIADLNKSFGQMREASQKVYEYSEQLAQTSESVADSATTQTVAVNSVASDMGHLTEQTQKITERAMRIRENSDMTNEHLQKSEQQMQELVLAMDSIEHSSAQIVAFADEIANIADQTNLLALNASIEAARAGEAGKGFAVVASEIGALATSSAEASENISKLIAESKRAVEKGKEMVDVTSVTMKEGVKDSLESESQIDEIVEYVKSQQSFIGKIDRSLQDIAQVVEMNAASAEENTAISQELSDCSQILLNMANAFSLKDE